MNDRKVPLLFAALLVTCIGLAAERARAATPTFTLSAGNATMPASGTGSVAWTVTSVDGYSTTFGVTCSPTNASVGAKLPICGGGAVAVSYKLAANGTVQGTMPLSAKFCSTSSVCPVKLDRRRQGFAGGAMLAGALLVGLGFKRRRSRWITLMMLAVGLLAGLGGIAACGGGNTLTPGVWQYTLTASDVSNSASTTVNVTVPPGIPVSYY